MITPTNGRIVWFWPSTNSVEPGFIQHDSMQPMAAIVTYVWHDRLVNLTVFDHNGGTHSKTSVPLQQDGDPTRSYGYYAEWMPYQKGQAAKTEQIERQLNNTESDRAT